MTSLLRAPRSAEVCPSRSSRSRFCPLRGPSPKIRRGGGALAGPLPAVGSLPATPSLPKGAVEVPWHRPEAKIPEAMPTLRPLESARTFRHGQRVLDDHRELLRLGRRLHHLDSSRRGVHANVGRPRRRVPSHRRIRSLHPCSAPRYPSTGSYPTAHTSASSSGSPSVSVWWHAVGTIRISRVTVARGSAASKPPGW